MFVSVLTSNAVDRGHESGGGQGWGQTKDNEYGICCFFVEQAALRSKKKTNLPRNQDNMSEWSNVSTGVLLCP